MNIKIEYIFLFIFFIIPTMDMVQFIFDILRNHLPDEIIHLIVFKYRCVKHPIVNLLLNYTKCLYCENNQKTYLGLKINSAYDKLKSKDGDINKLIKDYLNDSMIEFNTDLDKRCFDLVLDYGYYLKRPWGRLFYNRKYDHNKVQEGMKLENWKLKRSENIINNFSCKCKHKLKFYYQINKREVKIYSRAISHINYDSVTRDLIFMESRHIKNGKYICSYCKIDKERFKKYHEKPKFNTSYV